jgi:hypothetical protein
MVLKDYLSASGSWRIFPQSWRRSDGHGGASGRRSVGHDGASGRRSVGHDGASGRRSGGHGDASGRRSDSHGERGDGADAAPLRPSGRGRAVEAIRDLGLAAASVGWATHSF